MVKRGKQLNLLTGGENNNVRMPGQGYDALRIYAFSNKLPGYRLLQVRDVWSQKMIRN